MLLEQPAQKQRQRDRRRQDRVASWASRAVVGWLAGWLGKKHLQPTNLVVTINWQAPIVNSVQAPPAPCVSASKHTISQVCQAGCRNLDRSRVGPSHCALVSHGSTRLVSAQPQQQQQSQPPSRLVLSFCFSRFGSPMQDISTVPYVSAVQCSTTGPLII